MEYTIKQASEALNVSTDTIRRRIKQGTIKAHKVEGKNGPQWAIPEEELIKDSYIVEKVPFNKDMNSERFKQFIGQSIGEALEASQAHQSEQMEAMNKHIKELTETVQRLNKALGIAPEEPETKNNKRGWRFWQRD